MSTPRYDWWGYVKGMIFRYPSLKQEYTAMHQQSITANLTGMPRSGVPQRAAEQAATRELPPVKQREMDAVERAVDATRRKANGREVLFLIDLVFWQRRFNLTDAAWKIGLSYRTAARYHREFIRLVAKYYGLLDD